MKEKFEEIKPKKVIKDTQDKVILIGKNVKALREKHKITQNDLAFWMYSDKNLISSLERGVYKNLTLLTLIKISSVFNIEVEELLK